MTDVESIIKKCNVFLRIRRTKAISTVLTTMIILVASVVLGIGVVIYGTSLFQTGTLQEVIEIKGIKLWVNATDTAGLTWGAAGVRNSGDKLISVDQIIVRGTTVPFSNWYVDTNQTRVTTANFQSQFVHNGTGTCGDAHELDDSTCQLQSTVSQSCPASYGADGIVIEMDFDGNDGGGATDKKTICLKQASGPTALEPGERMIVYFKIPNGIIIVVDAGLPTNVGIFGGKTGAPITTIISNP